MAYFSNFAPNENPEINRILNSNAELNQQINRNLERIESIEDQTIAKIVYPKIIDGEFFKKESLLCRGARSNVYKCRRLCSGRIVAIKEIPEGQAYLHEGQIMKDLSSDHGNWPYFVRLYNEFANVTARYYVMECCTGETLEKLVKQNGGGLSSESCEFHMAHLAEGVKKLHSLDFVHRDLKPSNILVTKRSDGVIQLKISNFHLAQPYCDPWYHKLIYLQPSPYRVIELTNGQPYDKSVDVYSLGAIYFFMLDGKDPNFQFDKCGYPIFPNETRNKRLGMIGNRMMCRRADGRLALEELEMRDGLLHVNTQRDCAVCGRKLDEI